MHGEDHELIARTLLPTQAIDVARDSGHVDGDRLIEASRPLTATGVELRPFAKSGTVAAVAEALDVPVYDAHDVALAAAAAGRAYTADDTLQTAVAGMEYRERVEPIDVVD